MADRRIHIPGLRNGRDLGGLPAGGGVIRSNCLLRSACLSGVLREDVEGNPPVEGFAKELRRTPHGFGMIHPRRNQVKPPRARMLARGRTAC